ncbi:Bug family tripartite tricarboxylate transporter substrate binding protein [Roseomonas marmotae]|uniref:Tripartite tricarboxylate transporter substrate binding protein n=1 Tax=Roseomonas marmotae TaxID=2768161 RepID=A0ABS3KI97_9PROT|nr:tripartite tricarboxylate transporter substrate binding protein [Roseomonas marmotae]MBO1077179.1 tripartite tricarboxylate transporter substrate binding protein [Roseomonas marmotae]QTI82046.1 tripartite tricarboxylate transporter substrate binding protein [Roseomonas marmotae]
MAAAVPASAQAAFPNRPIRIIVPFAAGGNVDLQCRILAEKMGQLLKGTILVENRAGAGGAIGAEAVAHSAPDGYTLLGGSNGPMTVSPALRTDLGYDPLRDFAPLALTSRAPMALAVSKKLGVDTLQDFLALASSRPGHVTVASSGTGSSSHLVLIDFGLTTRTSYEHIPYRGASATVPDLISGNVDGVMTEVSNISPAHAAGQVKILGIAATNRSMLVPEVPTFAQAGVPGFIAFSFCGLFAPARTPEAVLQVLSRAAATALTDHEVRKKFEDIGLEIPEAQETAPASMSSVLKRELEIARRVGAAAGIKLQN